MITLKIWEAIAISEDKDFQYFVSNNVDFQGKIKIPLDKVKNFEEAIKNNKITPDKWEARVIKEEIKTSEKGRLK